MDCNFPGTSVRGILQARILQWPDVPSSRGSSQAKDRIQVSCIAGVFFTTWSTREAQRSHQGSLVLRMDIIEIPKTVLNRLQQNMNWEIPYLQAGFRKGTGTKDQIANICWIIEKARVPEKHLFLLYWPCWRLWLSVSQQTVENSERDGNTRPPDLPPEKPVCGSGNNSCNWTWNYRLVSDRERSTSRL